jgi:hypothetical protein
MSDVPAEFIPDGEFNIIADRPICPGCERELHQPELEYTCRKFGGETWHIDCACEESDAASRETPRYCPSCYAFSPWHIDGTDETARLCHGCGATFEQTVTKAEFIGERGVGADE